MDKKASESIRNISLLKIRVVRNPRQHFDQESIAGLAQSIKGRGLQQPIIVEPGKGDWFELVSGERRLRAHQQLGRKQIKAIVRARSNHNGRERFLDAIIENDQREDMNAIERARAYRVLRDEYGMTARAIAVSIGKAETYIGNYLLLTDLEEEIQVMIEKGFWKDPRLARGLLHIEDATVRLELARRLFKQRVSLKGCLAAVERTLQAVNTGKVDFKRGTPALKLANADQRPMQWDMLRQLGQLPAWELVVHAAEQTCQACPLRSIASRQTCRDCGAVDMLRKMMEAGHGRH